jgi:hypothetical protein
VKETKGGKRRAKHDDDRERAGGQAGGRQVRRKSLFNTGAFHPTREKVVESKGEILLLLLSSP